MGSSSPTAEGFKLIFRRPLIPLAEIAWRWSFGFTAWLLLILFLVEYANGLPVNTVDRFLLRSKQGALIIRAIQRIFHGSGLRFTKAAILLAIASTIAWIMLASLGRATTLKAIIAEFGLTQKDDSVGGLVYALFGLNTLRAVATLAAITALIGSALFANGIWASTHVSIADATRLWFVLLFGVWCAWAVVNWVLSLSALPVATDGARPLPAISRTVDWFRARPGRATATGIWFELAHGGAFIMALGAGFTVLGMAGVLGAGPTMFLEILIVGVYCAVADFLYIGRLAAYLAIIRDDQSPGPVRQAEIHPPDPALERSEIDQSEAILSDVPLPAT